jgi:hypothetical protein
MRLQLAPFKDSLEYKAEFELTAAPQAIDIVIIKKAPGAVIDDPIARIFRRHNIVEYKGYGDNLSIDDFRKTMSYAWMYSTLERAGEQDITVTYEQTSRPEALLGHLKSLGCEVSEEGRGIYYASGKTLAFPVQVLANKEMDRGASPWLHHLRGGLTVEDANRIYGTGKGRPQDSDLETYMQAVAQANARVFGEVFPVMTQEFRQMLVDVGYEDELLRKGEEIGIEKGIAEGIEKFMATMGELVGSGLSYEEAFKTAGRRLGEGNGHTDGTEAL